MGRFETNSNDILVLTTFRGSYKQKPAFFPILLAGKLMRGVKGTDSDS